MPTNTKSFFSFFLLCMFAYSLAFSQSTSSVVLSANAGSSTAICFEDTTTIGGTPAASGGTQPYTYAWTPITGLNSPNNPNPLAFPTITTVYTLNVTDAIGNTASSTITINVFPPVAISAGPDQAIISGANTVLQGSGAAQYTWTPTETLLYPNTANPVSTPLDTTTYYLTAIDDNGCIGIDSVTVFVRPSDSLIFYNAFTPNQDGDNDFFYIGNIEYYPQNKLEIYNRNGKLVYQISPYKNEWNGKINNEDLPCATYYFIFYPGKDKDNVEGPVTILR